MPIFFTNYRRAPQVAETNNEPTLTRQEFKNESDINHLVARYSQTGFFYDPLAIVGQKRAPMFEDFSGYGDFAEQQNRILAVYDAFASLPSSIREKFGHNPAAFVEFVGNPANHDECVKMGLVTAEVKKAETVTEPKAGEKPAE